jgi:large subunit ribosomal protein L35
MPKLRTKKSVAKRVRLTGTGKLKRMRQFSGCHHIREKKSPKRVRKFRHQTLVSPVDEPRLRRCVPYLQ